MTGKLKGRVACVTGAASGIGRATALLFAREGAAVVATDVSMADPLTAKQIADAGGCFLRHDASLEEDWSALAAEISARLGPLHILVNNAGIGSSGPITDIALSDWRRVMAVNLDGVFLGIKHLLPLLRASGGGSIVNVSSVAGIKPSANASAYAASKGGVRLLSKAVALECAAAGDGVRVNSIHPGIVETAIWDDLLRAKDGDIHGVDRGRILGQVSSTIPLGRIGTCDEIAQGILWLASNESSYVTGAELVIDGGRTLT